MRVVLSGSAPTASGVPAARPPSLFVLPGECNFSGVRHDLRIVQRLQAGVRDPGATAEAPVRCGAVRSGLGSGLLVSISISSVSLVVRTRTASCVRVHWRP